MENQETECEQRSLSFLRFHFLGICLELGFWNLEFILRSGWQMIARSSGCERKVRTPSGSMPRRMRGRVRRKPGVTESVTENKPPFASRKIGRGVRVKRRGKSPPPGAQAPGHEKPHAVQDTTGSPGRLTPSRFGGTASGY